MICGNAFSTALIHYQSKSVYLTLKMNTYIHRIIHCILDMVVSGPFYNRYVKLSPKDQTPKRFGTIQSCILSSRIVMEQLMALILMHLFPMMLLPAIAIVKAASHKMFLLHVLSTCGFLMFFPVGKAVLRMGVYLTMHGRSHLPSHQEHTFWQMLGFQLVMHS